MGRFRGVELDEIELRGERLTLRRWRREDAADVLTAMTDPSMRDFLALPDPYTAEHATAYVTGEGHEGRGEGTGLGCAVVETDSARLVGSAALRLEQAPDVGYWIAADARGHGYAAEATRLLTSWAHDHGVHRVEVRCDVRNLGSVRSALAAGFAFDGVRRGAIGTADGRHDLAVFGRLATDPGAPIPVAFPELPSTGLSDGVVRLRRTEAADAAALAEQERDELTLASGFTGTAPPDDAVQRMAARCGLDWLVGTALGFTVVDAATGSLAGAVRVRLNGPPRIGGVGYAVHPAFRGRGYTARALRLLIAWAFGPAGLARLELGAKSANVASQRAALAAGFEPDGTMAGRLRAPDGTFHDEVRFAVVNPAHRIG